MDTHKLCSEDVQYVIDHFGNMFNESCVKGDGSDFRRQIDIHGHAVINEFSMPNLVKTIDNKNCQYFVGYNTRGFLCYAPAPVPRPKHKNKNYLMCRLYDRYNHYIREATEVESIASFEEFRDGNEGVIYPDNLEIFQGTPCSISVPNNTDYPCWVESESSGNWHQTRLVSDNVMVSDWQETYYTYAIVNEDGTLPIDDIKSDFESTYCFGLDDDGSSVCCTLTDMVTEKEYRWEFDSTSSND